MECVHEKYVYEMCSSVYVILTLMQEMFHACKLYEMSDIFAEKSNTLLFLPASHLLANIYLIASGTMILRDPRERVSGVALPLMRYAYASNEAKDCYIELYLLVT